MERFLAKATVQFRPGYHRIGPAPDEIVLHYAIASSIFEGSQIHFSAVPDTGSEWATMRSDGVMALESRQVLRTPANDLICTAFSGLYDAGDDGYLDALDGALTAKAPARLAIRFYTACKEYRWLNRTQFLGRGERDFACHCLDLQIVCP